MTVFVPTDRRRSPAALAEHAHQARVEVDVVRLGVGRRPAEVGDLGPSRPGIDEDPEDRRVAPAGNRPIGVDHPQERLELGLAEDRGRLLGHLRRPHPGHRRRADQLFLDRPPEEGLEPGVAVVGGGRRVAVEEVLDERLEVLTPDGLERRRPAGRCEKSGELARRLEVGPDRLRAEVGRPEMAGERGDVALEPRWGTMGGACQSTDHRW